MFRGYCSAPTILAILDGRLSRHAFTALALSGAVLFALFVCVARAEPPTLISYGNFESYGGVGLGVDQQKGDVYTAGLFKYEKGNPTSPGRIEKFSETGELLPPSPFGEGFHSGAAVNPTNGDLYVLNAFGEIETFDPTTGVSTGASFPVPASNNFFGSFSVIQIATDSNGDVYVPVSPENDVLEYSSAGTLLKTFTGGGALKGPTGVAVDSFGNLWVADAGNNRIEELSPTDTSVGEIKSEGVESVALDGRGDLFAVVENSIDPCGSLKPPCLHLSEYNSAGKQVADVGAGSFGGGGFQPPSMVAVGEASGRVYVSDGEKGLIWIFGPPAAPIVGKELTAEVAASEAKLGALVNPGGIEATYHFEYDAREYREGEAPHGKSTPIPEGSVGEGVTSRTVWAGASGLAPGTTYHYRVVATNELGTAYGPDQTFTTETAEQAVCPNEELRGGFSVRLPDCRAYELVTPPTKTSSQPRGVGPAGANGNAIAFSTEEPLLGAPNGSNYYVFTRGAGGWSWEDVLPLESYSGVLCSNQGKSSSVPAYSDELSTTLVSYGGQTRASQGASSNTQYDCNAEGLEVVGGEPVGYLNLLVRDSKTGTYRLVNASPPGVTPADAHFRGASSDLSHVIFSEMALLTPGASYGVENLFEWDEGVLRLLTVLPNGTSAVGSLAAEGEAAQYVSHPISADGSHILFTSGGLYDRIDGERTVQIDEKQAGAAGPSGGGVLQTASRNGLRVFFTDESRLTLSSTAASGKPDLYECEIVEEEQAGKRVLTCKLSDLTDAKAGEHADVLHVSGLGSEDSSHVYFTATGVLADNKREYEYIDAEGKDKKVAEEATSGENNLYVDHDGTITFVAKLFVGDDGTGAVSPDGASFAFDSSQSLTGYDNRIGSTTAHEIFLYSAATVQLVCASCDPSGKPAVAGGADLPSLASRPLSDGGRLFFETGEALVPSDTNGQNDVYEYENGQPSLISSGTSSSESTFSGASESGGDAFFQSTQQLVPQDTEEEEHVVYDARVGGGFPAIASPPACTTADACRTPVSPQPSLYGAPASQTLSGLGNLTPPVKAKSKKKARPKKVKPKKKTVCGRSKHKHARCATQRTGSKAKSHKGGK
jgi:hypothetical protein